MLARLLCCLTLLLASPAWALISQIGSSSAVPTGPQNSLTLNLPAGVQAGDLLLAQIVLDGNTTLNMPNGWTLLRLEANTVRQGLYYRFATASEAASFTWDWSSNRRAGGGIVAYRGVDPNQPFGTSAVDTGNSDEPEALAQLVVEPNSLLVTLFALNRGNESLTAPPGMSTAYRLSSTENTGVSLLASYEQRPALGDTGVRTATSSAFRAWVAHSLLLRPEPEIVLEWHLNEPSWTGAASEVLDTSGNGLNASVFSGANTLNTSPALSGDPGTCRYGQFVGASSQYLQTADNNRLDLTGSFTIGLWVRPSSLPASGLMSILSKDENYEFHLKPNGRVNWWWQTSGPSATNEFDSTTALPLNSWSHLVIRYAPGDQRIYINGTLAGSASFTGTPLSNSDPLQLGQDQGFAGRYFNGALDELRIYSGALSTAEIQALAQERTACAAELDHYEFSYASNALTCQPHSVTLKACTNAACSLLLSTPATAQLQPSGWVGGDNVSFTGSATYSLAVRTASTVTLGLSSPSPAATNPLQCRIDGGAAGSNCALSFAESGLAFDIPTLLAGKPQGGIQLRAVRKSDNGADCVPAFANVTRAVQFWSTYLDPTPAEQQGGVQVNLNSTAVSGSAGAPTSLNLAFDGTGAATLVAQYAEAGQLQMNARYQGSAATADTGLDMSGSDPFVSKPVGMCLATDTSSSCTAADTSCPPYPGARAGDPFSLRITPVAWQSDGDSNLCDNPATQNYRQSAIALGSQLLAPAGGDAGSLSPSSYDHALGGQNNPSLRQSEVGVFRLTATPAANAYFGETVAGGVSGLVGRFIPAWLGVSGSASLTPSCGTFSYQDQPMAFAAGAEPALIVTGYNRQNLATQNYDRGVFWRLDTPARADDAADPDDDYASVTGKASLDATGRLTRQGTISSSVSGVDAGNDGARTFRWAGEQLTYGTALSPTGEDLPFTAALRLSFPATGLTDLDGACYLNGAAACQPYSFDFGGSQVRLGRLRLGNAHGSELQGLSLPLVIESWQGSAASSYFAKELEDNCSAPQLNTPALVAGTFTGNLAAGETTPSLSAIASGEGQLQLSVPGAGNDGSVAASLTMPNWLLFDWAGTNTRQAARGLATFGIYGGSQRLIFRREQYRP